MYIAEEGKLKLYDHKNHFGQQGGGWVGGTCKWDLGRPNKAMGGA